MTLNRRQFLRQSIAFSALASAVPAQVFVAPEHAAKHIFMLGDWGKDGEHSAQSRVAASMQSYAREFHIKPDSLFMLGDNWYGNMPGGANDPRWQTQFEQMYPESVFPNRAYAVMGNHDYQQMPEGVRKTEMALAYPKSHKTRWTQPALWYTFDFPEKDPLMKVIALDTNYHKLKLNIEDHITYYLTHEQRIEQLQWLTAELKKPTTATFTVMMGHHPLYSNGRHGDHKQLIADWDGLLREHRVHLYLAGHDHDMQHLEFANHPTSFVCSGAGGADLYDIEINQNLRGPYANKVYGFTHLEVTPTSVTIRHINDAVKTVHAFTKDKTGKTTLL